MYSYMGWRNVVILPFFISHATSLTAWNVSAAQVVRHLWMTSVIVDSWLFIDGGEYWAPGTSSYYDIKYPPTLSIDLSKSWTTSTVVINQITDGSRSGSSRLGFAHEGLFYNPTKHSISIFGGDPYSTDGDLKVPIRSLVLASPTNGDGIWSRDNSTSSSTWQHLLWPIQASYAYTSSGGFAVGGYTAPSKNVSVSPPLLQMVIVNTSSSTETTYSANSDLGPLSAAGGVAEGAGHFVPMFGASGIAVFLGGYSISGAQESLRSMSTVTFYDVATGTWYSQTAAGDVPLNRRNICLTGARGVNSSTYEIFLFGGSGIDYFSATANTDSTHVYILTLPGFRWIRTPATTTPRAGSSCHAIRNQMLSFGGFDPTGAASFTNKDPWTYGIGIFDMTELTWGSSYNVTSQPYRRSSLVDNYYASSPLNPTWDNITTAQIFANSLADSSAPQSPTSPASANPSPAASATPTLPSTGAIAGAVVGALLALAVGFFLIWRFCIFPARRAKQKGTAGSVESEEQGEHIGKTELDVTHHYLEMDRPHNYPEIGSGDLKDMLYETEGNMINEIDTRAGPYEVAG